MVSQRAPDWLIQLCWFASALGATGAFWYFLAQKNYAAAIWSGVGTVVLVVFAIALHIRNDRAKAELSNPATTEQTPSTTLSDQQARQQPTDKIEAEIAAADSQYSPATIDEFFDTWFNKAKTSLQRDEFERQMLNRRVIWEGIVKSVESDRGDTIQVLVAPITGSGTAFLYFDASQRAELLKVHPKQILRFTGVIRSFVASPFIRDCRILRVRDPE